METCACVKFCLYMYACVNECVCVAVCKDLCIWFIVHAYDWWFSPVRSPLNFFLFILLLLHGHTNMFDVTTSCGKIYDRWINHMENKSHGFENLGIANKYWQIYSGISYTIKLWQKWLRQIFNFGAYIK